MEYYSEETYGERIAGVYDQWYSEFDPAAIRVLAELAHGGRALELGIGTGRIAIPLLKIGVTVHGIDASVSMVSKLRSKPGGERIPVILGNFVDVPDPARLDVQVGTISLTVYRDSVVLVEPASRKIAQQAALHTDFHTCSAVYGLAPGAIDNPQVIFVAIITPFWRPGEDNAFAIRRPVAGHPHAKVCDNLSHLTLQIYNIQ